MTTKAKVLDLALARGVEVEYGYDRECNEWRIELMSYGKPFTIVDCHCFIIDSSNSDRIERDAGLAAMKYGWRAAYEALMNELYPCTDDRCEDSHE